MPLHDAPARMPETDALDLTRLDGKLIVSCQPVPGGPMDRADIVAAFALAALDGVEARYRALRAEGQGGLALASAWIAGLEQQPPGDDATAVGCAVPARWEWLLLLLLLLAVLTWPR